MVALTRNTRNCCDIIGALKPAHYPLFFLPLSFPGPLFINMHKPDEKFIGLREKLLEVFSGSLCIEGLLHKNLYYNKKLGQTCAV